MKRSALLLAAALAAFGAAIGTRAAAPMGVNDAIIMADATPRTLTEFGFFTDGPAQVPAAGVIPYRLNMPLFSDGADKLRFVYIPQGNRAQADGANLLDFPVGTALIKTFAFGTGQDRRLIETRVLLHRTDGWLALPYVWNTAQTEAKLALAGARVPVTTPQGQAISYRVPNKNQCKECHGLQGAVVPIGPKARNLSHEWLAMLQRANMLDAVPNGSDIMPKIDNALASDRAQAARAYLDVNCAHCHRPNATASNSGLDLRWEQDEPQALGVWKRPVAAGRGSGGHEFDIVPGKPGESILSYRMRSTEPGIAMPELGKQTVDEQGVALVDRWIAAME